jgi:NAD(P)-dependent dehydrogenase (short-subunit alcohol dehydrogenase family)
MGALDGRTVIVTGAGRGIGREYALLCAAEGANVMVNDLGSAADGSGADSGPASEVVAEIRAWGGRAEVNGDDVADAAGAGRLVESAIARFGGLDVLVNNAGILRDRMLVNLSDADWDDVIRVHLRGHFLPLRAAAVYWRDQHKQGATVQAAVINTASTSGLFGQAGQANYGAAKSGIAGLTMIANLELARYGVRVNAICPAARTRLTDTLTESASSGFDLTDPANVAPFVAYLATSDCPIAGRTFFVMGGSVHLFRPWSIADSIHLDRRWTVAELRDQAARFAEVDLEITLPY